VGIASKNRDQVSEDRSGPSDAALTPHSEADACVCGVAVWGASGDAITYLSPAAAAKGRVRGPSRNSYMGPHM
jgi:hypothetical protein